MFGTAIAGWVVILTVDAICCKGFLRMQLFGKKPESGSPINKDLTSSDIRRHIIDMGVEDEDAIDAALEELGYDVSSSSWHTTRTYNIIKRFNESIENKPKFGEWLREWGSSIARIDGGYKWQTTVVATDKKTAEKAAKSREEYFFPSNAADSAPVPTIQDYVVYLGEQDDLPGYITDKFDTIELPLLGAVSLYTRVQAKSREEAERKLQMEIKEIRNQHERKERNV